MNRADALHRLQTETFDVCIIGGGATGAGCALDAALRGLRVCLIEEEDFAAQTSSKSTKLIHGGVRYLEQAVKTLSREQFLMVRKSLAERRTLLRNAPHLTRELALLTPCRNAFEAFYYTVGLKIYDYMAGRRNLRPSRWLSGRAARSLIPELKANLHSAVVYYDGQLDDARFCLALVKSAAAEGAVVINHLKIKNFHFSRTGKINGATAQEGLTGETFRFRAEVFVNATGPFADALRHLANPRLRPRMRVSRGSHIVLDAEHLSGQTAILVPKTDDGRVLFLIPWQGRVLVGTTDLEDTLSRQPQISEAETDYLIDYVNRYLGKPVSRADVRATFAGQRPLVQATFTHDTKSLVRDHEVETDNRTRLISILGGKWTTYRLMAKDTLDEVCRELNVSRKSATEHYVLVGGKNFDPGSYTALMADYGLSEATARHLLLKYGDQASAVAGLTRENPGWAALLVAGKPLLQAEVVFAARHEMARTPDDVLARRLGLSLTDAAAAAAARPVVESLLQA